MGFKTYEIKKGDTLVTIAKEFGLTINELLDFHNSHAILTQQIFSTHIPFHIKELFTPAKKEEIKKKSFEQIDFQQKARYRCEQINTSKFNNNLVYYLNQRFQYVLKLNVEEEIGFVKLEDYSKESSPKTLEEVFDFIEETEKIKNNVFFSLNKLGKIQKILNKKEMQKDWKKFKATKFFEMPFIQSLQKNNPKAVDELLMMADSQFSENASNEEEYWRNFFYFSCFDQYLYSKDNFETVDFDFVSTILPPLILPLKIRYDKVEERNGILTVRKIAEVSISDSLKKEMKDKYNEIHKSIVKYEFTEYKIIFRSTIEIDIHSGLILSGKVVLKEEVSDNVENECIYTIKKLENFTP
ncbi:LysM peptidoglycan-binding domain-containing protein [Chryseobacterium sp. JM1]|uniref:LysM peptidoglycan-binding domain-containing protein n=1 Tax=Chryseobacterium sp. JM1 TaxID=1233950 RepID=UPI0004E74B8C|nr:LysM domain-containing protein [Chryseobacterium sp. JM1]KFF18899.1 hypothetical protein IW22_17005 [Chryseobacterium sp. JM1]